MIPRKLTLLDKSRVIEHLQLLQGDDRRLRFGAIVSDEYIAEYVGKHFDDSKWFGIDHVDGRLIATCHVSVFDNNAELGCSVDSDQRGNGYAQKMFDRAITWLRTKNVKTVFMHCLTENQIMRHIARKNDMTVVSCCGESDAEVMLEPADTFTPIMDAYSDRISMYDMIYKNNVRLIKNTLEVITTTK